MIEYTLRMNPEQARTADKAIELFLRLKLGQYEELPFALMDMADEDFCDRRDTAKMFLKAAWCTMHGEVPPKDEEWYRLYNLHQALRFSGTRQSSRTAWAWTAIRRRRSRKSRCRGLSGGRKMAKIEAFFVNGNRAKFDMDKVAFLREDTHFDFRDASEEDEEDQTFADIIQRGALVNWNAVSFIRVVEDKEGDE